MDLVQLIRTPKKDPNRSITRRAASRELEASGRSKGIILRSVPSAGPTSIPLVVVDDLMRAKGSTVRANIPGDSGQPCLVPLCRLKGGERVPLVLTLAVGFGVH